MQNSQITFQICEFCTKINNIICAKFLKKTLAFLFLHAIIVLSKGTQQQQIREVRI